MEEDGSKSHLALTVPKDLVKRVKDALDHRGRLDKRTKIKPMSGIIEYQLIDGDHGNVRAGTFCVPITKSGDDDDLLPNLVRLIHMQDHGQQISLVATFPSDVTQSQNVGPRANLLARTIQQWLQQRPRWGCDDSQQIISSMKAKIHSHSWTYTIYPPLLLISPATFSDLSSINEKGGLTNDLASLYICICKTFGIDHIALSAPIASTLNFTSPCSSDPAIPHHFECEHQSAPNVLRSPTGLTPLYGDFGPDLPWDHSPSADNFASAFWCTAQQNGIFQTWAPRYTMFSRGNISEKARLLNLESLKKETLGTTPSETSAVDLYAGIGYFAFSYAKAGVGKVLCWEINPWSVEGLRRGAKDNNWKTAIIQDDASQCPSDGEDSRILVFQESNEYAAVKVDAIRETIPPVKHVNCGYLPTSKDSWEVAVQVLDSTGGWIHAHENIAKKSIDTRRAEIVNIFVDLVNRRHGEMPETQSKVECEHVERVKSYAPGVIHCVLDIAISLVDLP